MAQELGGVDKFWVNPSGRSHKKRPELTPQARGDFGKRTQTSRATPDTPTPLTAQEVHTPKIGGLASTLWRQWNGRFGAIAQNKHLTGKFPVNESRR